jgi:hypothetical protein
MAKSKTVRAYHLTASGLTENIVIWCCEEADRRLLNGWVTQRNSSTHELLISGHTSQIEGFISGLISRTLKFPKSSLHVQRVNYQTDEIFSIKSALPPWDVLRFDYLYKKNPSNIEKTAQELINKYRKNCRRYSQDIFSLANHIGKIPISECVTVSNQLRASLATEHIQEKFKLNPRTTGHSFRACIAHQQRWDAAWIDQCGQSPAKRLNNKSLGVKFVSDFNMPTPRLVYKGPVQTLPWHQLQNVVIKPLDEASARGVHIVKTDGTILNLPENRLVDSIDKLREQLLHFQQARKTDSNQWIVESLILNNNCPPRDFKFYCFYGQIGLVLETRVFPSRGYAWLLPDGQPVDTGKYSDKPLEPSILPKSASEMASTLSRAIPLPFIRIDFLLGDDGPVFCEFTPYPGRYDQFNHKINTQLGMYYAEAEARLYFDLMRGKQFSDFFKTGL